MKKIPSNFNFIIFLDLIDHIVGKSNLHSYNWIDLVKVHESLSYVFK